MQTFIDFLVNNYLWFLIISLVLVFALIGYLVDTSEAPKKTRKKEVIEPMATSLDMNMNNQTNTSVDNTVVNTTIEQEPINTIVQDAPETELLEDID